MQVSIKYVNPPGPNSSGKYGSISSVAGQKIYVPIDLLGQFRVGTVVEIATKEQTWGTTPVTVATSGPLAPGQQYPTAGVQQPVQHGGAQPGYPGPNVSNPGQRGGFQPRVYQGGAGQQTGGRPSDPEQARQIFVTGVVGRAMGSGKFAASEIPVLAQAAQEAWDKVALGLHPDLQQASGPPGLEQGDPGPESM